MSAIAPPSKTKYLTVPETATKKDQLKVFSKDEVAKVRANPDSFTRHEDAVAGNAARGLRGWVQGRVGSMTRLEREANPPGAPSKDATRVSTGHRLYRNDDDLAR